MKNVFYPSDVWFVEYRTGEHLRSAHPCSDHNLRGGEQVREANMRYNPELDRWSVQFRDSDYGLHCGEALELVVSGKPHPGRLELGETWYVVVDGVGLGLRPNEVYQIRI